MVLNWSCADTPRELHSLLATLGEEYPLAANSDATLHFIPIPEQPGQLRVERTGDGFSVYYGRLNLAARGVAYALAGETVTETTAFTLFGILLDASRNAVPTVANFKCRLRRLALLGYDSAMLYTKDAYTLEGEPYFGYMRGAYTIAEIREIDAYARGLNITMIASIQALGHLEPSLRWDAYAPLRDTNDVILVDYEPSYRLIEKMLDFWSRALDSRRIHLGMDETWGLGTGRFQTLHGYERPFDIYNRHLARVCEMCKKFDFQPIIWSDMYFRLGNPEHNYYDPATQIPEDVQRAIAPTAQLAYWDYYHTDAAFYADFIRRHRALGKEPLMASGVWSWSRLWYDHEQTVRTAGPCIDACRATQVHELLFTLWGDDGNYCEFDSTFAGLAWCADYAFNADGAGRDARLEKLFAAIFSTSYARQLIPATLSKLRYDEHGHERYRLHAPSLLWDDPLMALAEREIRFYGANEIHDYVAGLRKMLEELTPHADDCAAGRIGHAVNLATALIGKLEFRSALTQAYAARDWRALTQLADVAVPALCADLDALDASFRAQWLRSYKSYGLEIMQIRIGGLKARYAEVARRIHELQTGAIAAIDELESHHPAGSGHLLNQYYRIATANWQL